MRYKAKLMKKSRKTNFKTKYFNISAKNETKIHFLIKIHPEVMMSTSVITYTSSMFTIINLMITYIISVIIIIIMMITITLSVIQYIDLMFTYIN